MEWNLSMYCIIDFVKIVILCEGKIRERWIREGEREYLNRIGRFVNIEVKEVDKLGMLEDFDVIIALDVRGKEMGSLEFSKLMEKFYIRGEKVCFLVGGWKGLEKDIKMKADLLLSLSKLTFPYQIARLILLEQIYRAFTIIKGIDYHK
ncbi:MAG: 23S rRNA (pseudouridine(1915)-N(3))-methyltransferase RlmH [Thermoplasmata archaeon]|nr:MAG: 23S rRNA (pseudouridine(1915)-N(3))-methyltransferase RlmH [Thermoplasmata archaeon]